MPEKNSVNFIFSAKIVSLFHRLPLGAGIARLVTDCAKPLVIFLLRLLHSLPPGGKVSSASEADEGQPKNDGIASVWRVVRIASFIEYAGSEFTNRK